MEENKDNTTGAEASEKEVVTPENETVEAVKEEPAKKLSRKEKKEEKKKFEEETGRMKAQFEEEKSALNAKIAETNDKYLRLAAEFDNYRRRTAKERLDLITSGGEDVLKGILPTLDDCEKALEMLAKLEGCQEAVEGTRLIYDKLMAFLKSRGVARIEALGSDFDTDLHEAVAQFPVQEEDKKNKVIDVVRQGYKLKDKVIRYAQVVVGI